LVDFVKQFGVKTIVVDCDGKIDQLIPLWVKAGVTGMFPLEAVNDVVALREAFPRLQILGAVDKRPLIEGSPAGIDTELRRIEPLLRQGGARLTLITLFPRTLDGRASFTIGAN
jgi:hypothetical protein